MLPKRFLKSLLLHPDWLAVRKMYGPGSKKSIWSEAVCRFILGKSQEVGAECGDLYRKLCSERAEDAWRCSFHDDSDFQTLSEDLVAFLNRVPAFMRSQITTHSSLASDPGRNGLDAENPGQILPILDLESVRRTGWTRVIPAFFPEAETADDVETVAVHSIKTGILAAALTAFESAFAFEMGICHDMAEVLVGDLTPYQVVSVSEKHDEERKAFDRLLAGMSPEQAEKLRIPFMAYLDNTTEIAHIVHIADKLDMALQALAYEQRFHINLHEFYESAAESIESNWKALCALCQ